MSDFASDVAMTTEQAIALVGEIRLVYPAIDPERAVYLRDALLKFAEAHARGAWDDWRQQVDPSQTSRLDFDRFLAICRRHQAEAMTRGLREQAEGLRRRERDRGRELDEQWRQRDQRIGAIDPAELEKLRDESLNEAVNSGELDPTAAELLRKFDPRSSRTLKGLIDKRLAGEPAKR